MKLPPVIQLSSLSPSNSANPGFQINGVATGDESGWSESLTYCRRSVRRASKTDRHQGSAPIDIKAVLRQATLTPHCGRAATGTPDETNR
jgi:hypothetical protein